MFVSIVSCLGNCFNVFFYEMIAFFYDLLYNNGRNKKVGAEKMRRFTRERHIREIGITASQKQFDGEYNTHWHEFYEIEYMTEGEGDYVIDGEHYPICAGMLFFMTPLNFHSVNAKRCHGFNMMFSERLCNGGFLARLLRGSRGYAISVKEEDRAFFTSVLRELTRAEDEAYVSALLNSILGKLLIYEETGSIATTPVSKGVVYLLHHFRKNPTLAETAAYVGFAPTYFSALFKKETGETFQQYMDRLRFDYARKLLLHSELSVLQICRESGFEDYPNFIRRFKGRFGVSPGAMKRKN